MNPTLLGFIRKELIQSLRDPRMRVILFVIPVIQLILFGVALSNEVKNIRLAVVLDSRDTLLRDVYEHAMSDRWFIPVKERMQDPYEMVEAGKADAVLVPPPGGFTKAVGRGDGELQLLVNATNVLQAQAVEGYMQSIIQQTLKDDLKVTLPSPPIQMKVRVLFNPALETSIFMVPGVICMLMVITSMMLTNLSIVREKEMGTFEMLISAPISSAEIIFGKTIPYVIIGMSNLPLILAVAIFVFHVPMRGSFLVLTAAAFAFVCTAVALGTLISTITANQQQATLATFLVLFPMIIFSGLIFPLENMPAALQWIGFFDPLFHYTGLLRNIMLKGGETNYVFYHIAILVLMAVISVIASFLRFRTTLQ